MNAHNDIAYQAISLAECASDDIKTLIPQIKKLDSERNKDLLNEWEQLKLTKHNLRILEDNRIIGIAETHYDDTILLNCIFEYRNATRVIGSTMGRVDQLVSDAYLEHRVRKLIRTGKLLYRGKLLSMRDYAIKLK